jgi:ribonuclease HII
MLIAGVDEAGRGPLAGPVVAAAVILDPARPLRGLRDSKLLNARQRDDLAPRIRERAIAWAVASADVAEIDTLNILWATMLAMRRAVEALMAANGVRPAMVLVDGNRCPDWPHPSRAIVSGDALCLSIAAASIIAKQERDSLMEAHDRTYPGYGWASNKGYGTRAHQEALVRLGPTPLHRRSFAPVAQLLLEV